MLLEAITNNGGISAEWVLVSIVGIAVVMAGFILKKLIDKQDKHGEILEAQGTKLAVHAEKLETLEEDRRTTHLIKENTEEILTKLKYLKG